MKKGHSQLRVRQEHDTNCYVCPIRDLALFEAVRTDLLDWTQKFRTHQYALDARRHLYREGEVVDESYTLFQGWVMLYKTLDNNKRQVLCFALPGDFLGSRGSGGLPADHSAVAITDCVLCGFPEESLMRLFSQRPEIGVKLMNMQQRDQSRCFNHIMSVGQKNATESIAFMLIELYERCHECKLSDGSDSCFFPLSQEEIADYAGITLVHVSRVMKDLRNHGVLENSHRKIHILDADALRKIASINSL